jgi:DNA-directed RNA polymerase
LTKSKRLFNLHVRRAIRNEHDVSESVRTMLSSWETATRVNVGSVLASLLLSIAKVPVLADNPGVLKLTGIFRNKFDNQTSLEPAFRHTHIQRLGKTVGIVRPHQAVEQAMMALVQDGSKQGSVFMPKYLPMVIPPKPWLSYDSGGYLTFKSM